MTWWSGTPENRELKRFTENSSTDEQNPRTTHQRAESTQVFNEANRLTKAGRNLVETGFEQIEHGIAQRRLPSFLAPFLAPFLFQHFGGAHELLFFLQRDGFLQCRRTSSRRKSDAWSRNVHSNAASSVATSRCSSSNSSLTIRRTSSKPRGPWRSPCIAARIARAKCPSASFSPGHARQFHQAKAAIRRAMPQPNR